jgi:dolichol-phosphate mannosyltransferase
MADRSDVCVLLPTLDESATVGDVVAGFREHGFDDVLVIDGGSTDGTRERAREAGARIVVQRGDGKGQAVREAVADHVDRPYVLLADADATYRPADADAMLDPLLDGRADHVIGDRFADMKPGAMSRLNRLGNRIVNRAFAAIHGEAYADVLSGYRAFTRASFLRLDLSAEGFGIETELSVECVKRGVDVAVVPITYRPRPDGSDTNLRPFRDGGIIFLELYRKAKTTNPLFYFGSVGLASALAGTLAAGYVLYEWIVRGVGHEIIAVAGAGAILVGVQLLLFGFLADMILTLLREPPPGRPVAGTGTGTEAGTGSGPEPEPERGATPGAGSNSGVGSKPEPEPGPEPEPEPGSESESGASTPRETTGG